MKEITVGLQQVKEAKGQSSLEVIDSHLHSNGIEILAEDKEKIVNYLNMFDDCEGGLLEITSISTRKKPTHISIETTAKYLEGSKSPNALIV